VKSAREADAGESTLKAMKVESRLLRQLKGELLRSKTESKERLADIVRLKRRIDALASANEEVLLSIICCDNVCERRCERQLRTDKKTTKHALDASHNRKLALEKNLMLVSSRCLRAESMAAAMEQQLMVRRLNRLQNGE
jgi:hypothetical protein